MKFKRILLIGILSFGLSGVALGSDDNTIDCDGVGDCYSDVNSVEYSPLMNAQPRTVSVNKTYNERYKKYIRARFPTKIRGKGYRFFVFSPRMRQWAAYDASGYRVKWGFANGGAEYCNDVGRRCRTPGGSYRIMSKGSSSCKSSKYPKPRGGAPMPYCMFFRSAYAIHGSPRISNNNGSHGCIRVTTSAAKWLSENFLRIGTPVKVLPY